MRMINWWFVGGALLTIVVGAALGELWSLSSVPSVAAGWGGVIGIDIQESRRRAARPEPDPPAERWLSPVLALLVTAAFLALGLLLGVIFAAVRGDMDGTQAPLITSAILGVLAVAGVGALVVRRRRMRNAHAQI